MLPQDSFQDNIEALSTAIEERPPIPVEKVPPPPSKRRLYWMVAAFCALTVGSAEMGVLYWSDPPAAGAPPADMLALFESDPCAQRLSGILGAIAAYEAARGAPPATLAALVPDHLSSVPFDPATGAPFGYEVIGESISITCPGPSTQTIGPPAAPAPASGG